MAISKELVIKVVADFDAENTELSKAVEEIEAGAKAMTEQFGAAAANAHKALDTIGLGAENQVGRVTKLHNAFQGFTGMLGQGLGAVDNFAKALGPWNQALELGGKAVKFLGDGMDAYAKTSPEAAAEVAKLTAEFSGLKESVMAVVGEMTVGLLSPIPSIEKLTIAMEGLEEATERAFRWQNSVFNVKNHSSAQGERGFGYMLGGGFTDDVKSMFSRDTWNTLNADDALARVKAEIEATRKATDGATAAAARNRRERERPPSSPDQPPESPRWTQNQTSPAELEKWLGKEPEPTTNAFAGALAGAFGSAFKSINDGGAQVVTTIEAIARASEDIGPTLLERLGLQDPAAWDMAAAAAQGFSSAMQSSLQALGESTMSGGEVFKKGVGMIISALGDKLAANAAAEFITAGAMALTLNPMAAAHAGAGLLYSAGAAASYAAAAKLGAGSSSSSPSPGSAAGKGSTTGGSGGGSGQSGGGGSASSEGGPTQHTTIIVYGDNFADDSPRMRQLRAEELVRMATGGTGGRDD